MPNETTVGLLIKSGNEIADSALEFTLSQLGGVVPSAGERFVEFFEDGRHEAYCVVDRIFEVSSKGAHVSLVVEACSLDDLNEVGRFNQFRSGP